MEENVNLVKVKTIRLELTKKKVQSAIIAYRGVFEGSYFL